MAKAYPNRILVDRTAELKIEGLKHDTGKLEYHLLDTPSIEDVVRVFMFGKEKYSEGNWRFVKDGARRYHDAMDRHSGEIKKGNLIDEETGLPHAAHMAWNALAVLYFLHHATPQE